MAENNPSRRRFLCLALGGGAAFGLGLSSWPPAATRRTATSRPLQSHTRSSRALGTEVSILAHHEDQKTAAAAVDAAFAELELVESVMSLYRYSGNDYRPESQLCRLNRDGVLRNPHPYLVEVLRFAADVSRQTEGALDVTVQPLWSLFAAAKKQARLPSDAEIDTARSKVDWRRVQISKHEIRLRGEGMAVTLNGVAQGFAADRAAAALQKHGVVHALLNTGEIGTLGAKPDGQAWRVGIQHPREPDAYLALADLDGRCLSTSGDYATTFSDDFRHNHIFDPRTGNSPDVFSSVTVVAPTGLAADALSTAVFVLGVDRGLELIQQRPGADALLVMKDGRTIATRGFPEAKV